MRRFATICALVGVLATAGCNGEAPHPSAQVRVKNGNYTFNLEQYVIKDGATVNPSEFGKLVSTKNGKFNLNAGGQEAGTLELYDYSGNGYPDVMVIRRANGNIVSIGLDHESSQYETLKQNFGDRVKLYIP